MLAERAGEIAAGFGYDRSPADRASGFDWDSAYLGQEVASPSPRWDRLAAGQPLAIHFWYRQSPRPLETVRLGSVSERDPPLDVAGMADVVLDPRGRLVEFTGVPPQAEPPPGAPAPAPDWSAAFAAAGLDPAAFTPAEPAWTPPTYADRRAAWTGVYADHPDVPIRIEAAAYRDRPVYFRIVAPWDQPARDHEAAEAASRRAGYFLLLAVAGGGRRRRPPARPPQPPPGPGRPRGRHPAGDGRVRQLDAGMARSAPITCRPCSARCTCSPRPPPRC